MEIANQILQNPLFSAINMVLAISLVVFTFFSNARKQKDSQTQELLQIYERSVVAIKEEMLIERNKRHEIGNQLTVLTGKVGILEGQLIEKEKKLKEYMEILTLRNPQFEELLSKFNETQENNNKILVEIHSFMKHLSKGDK